MVAELITFIYPFPNNRLVGERTRGYYKIIKQ